MIKPFLTATILVSLLSCNQVNKNTSTMENKNETTNKVTPEKDNTPKVVGVGGIFFYSENPEKSKEWYTKNLGIEINNWGSSSFDSRDINDPEKINSLQWKPFKQGDEYFSPSKKEFMINYEVQHIEKLVQQLKANGVNVLDSIATYDYGKFVHIMDDEGNKIELWEPTKN